MDENDDRLKLDLGLGLGLGEYTPKIRDNDQQRNKCVFFLDLSIPLRPSDYGNIDPNSSMKIFGNSFVGDKEDDNGSRLCSRRKLRLTRDQITMLENSFRVHTTLNTIQKHALAKKLDLKPRQVEVWFQNRRARTKLKQTEIDCELLKKTCERLSDENRRLKKEISELQSSLLKIGKLQPPPPVAMQPSPPIYSNSKIATSREKKWER